MPTVLVVDDTPDIRMLVRLLLTRQGYQVIEAENGQQGVEAARAQRPDVILMDLAMPVLPGLAAIQLLRADKQFQNTPIVAFTAQAMDGDQAQALAAGADCVLLKPAPIQELSRLIQRLAPLLPSVAPLVYAAAA